MSDASGPGLIRKLSRAERVAAIERANARLHPAEVEALKAYKGAWSLYGPGGTIDQSEPQGWQNRPFVIRSGS